MSVSLLQQISRESLPVTVGGLDVAAVETLIEGGLVKATIHRDPAERGGCLATIHEITALGHQHLSLFGED